MARKAPRKTPEQRREQMEALHTRIAEQVEALRSTDEWKQMLKAMSHFHQYSFNNLLLILAQRPDATRVAGYGAWRKHHGRQVRKGEKGITIIAGSAYKKTQLSARTGEEEEVTGVRFFPTTVFDIAQTDPIEGEAKELPELAQKLEGEDSGGTAAAVSEWLRERGWSVELTPITDERNGYTDPEARRVVIDSQLSPAHIAKTALHEAAHVVMHADDGPGEYTAHRGLKETEAESVAYVVAGMLGQDTSAYSVGYVAGWSNADVDLIKSTAKSVHDAAALILEGVEARVQEVELAA